MADWDGAGLPPAAAARMARFRAGGVRTSLLDVSGGVAATNVGLPPVGEVMGCIVEHIGWQGWGGCGYYGLGTGFGWGNPRTVTSGAGQSYAGYRPYVDALYRGYDTALARMVSEASAMGADGVVGVRLTEQDMGEGNREFVALGTAVAGRGQSRPAPPFVTDLSGAQVGAMLRAGWVPVSIAVGISVAIRHDDYATRSQASAWGGPTEVAGYTELVTHVRSDARARFHEHAARTGADGAIVSHHGLRIWAHEAGEGHRDHVAESTVFGTAVAQFHAARVAQPAALTVLPLRRSRPASRSVAQ